MNDAPVNRLIPLPDRHGGAARLSVFFALWTLALLVMHDVRVNAAPIYESPNTADSRWLTAPVAVPTIDAASMWDALSQRSDVMSGRWSRAARKDAESVRPVAHVAKEHVGSRATNGASRKMEAAPVIKNASNVADAETQVAVRIAAGEFDRAIELIDEARIENPNATSQLRILDARVAIGRGDFERAYSILLEGLPDIHVSTRQHDLLAAVLVRTSRFAEAAAVYRALLTLDSANTRWWAGYAVTQEQLGRRSEEIGAYRTLKTLAPPGTALATWADERLQRIS